MEKIRIGSLNCLKNKRVTDELSIISIYSLPSMFVAKIFFFYIFSKLLLIFRIFFNEYSQNTILSDTILFVIRKRRK